MTISKVTALGDSVSADTGASPSSNGFAPLLAAALSATLVNKGASTRMAIDASADLYSLTAQTSSDLTTIEFGINDEAKYATDAAKLGYYLGAMRAHAVYRSSNITDITGAMTHGTGWAQEAFGSWASQTAGDYVQFTTSGDSFTLGSICQYPNAATFKVEVDGVSQGTFSTGAADPTSILGQHYGVWALSFHGFGAGSHTVKCTIVNGGSNGGAYFDWYTDHTSPVGKVQILTIPKATSFSGALSSGSNANVETYNGNLVTLASELAGYGLDVTLVETGGRLDGFNDYYDAVHPNNTGHYKWKTACYNAATGGTNLLAGGITAAKDRTASPAVYYSVDPTTGAFTVI